MRIALLALSGLLISALRVNSTTASPEEQDKQDTANHNRLPISSSAIEYLATITSDSFKRQNDLEESVWRSLPFLAAIFVFVAALLARAAEDLPEPEWRLLSIATHALLAVGLISLALVLWYLVVLLRARAYSLPAPDAEIASYAEEVSAYHRSSGVNETEADRRGLDDLRIFMARQYGESASINRAHNATRVEARGRVLVFLFLGFLLALACEMTIFITKHWELAPTARSSDHGKPTVERDQAAGSATRGRRSRSHSQAGASQTTVGDQRFQVLGPSSDHPLRTEPVTNKLVPSTPKGTVPNP
jgi:hypothetical protein